MPSRDARRPAAFFANALGDHLLNLPALAALAAVYPRRLTLVARRGLGPFFFGHLPLANLVEIDAASTPVGRSFDVDALLPRIGEVDLLLSLNPWHSPSVSELLRRVRPCESVGFFPEFATRLPLDFAKHSADLAFDVASAVAPELTIAPFAKPFSLPPAATGFARGLRRSLAGRRLLTVHNETKPEKTWPDDRLADLFRRLAGQRADLFVVLLAERAAGVDTRRLPDNCVVACGLPRDKAMALVAESDCFLGVDSFLLHVADLWRVPAVGLFGPTCPAEFGFRFTPTHVHLDGGGDVKTITPATVIDALRRVLRHVDRPGGTVRART